MRIQDRVNVNSILAPRSSILTNSDGEGSPLFFVADRVSWQERAKAGVNLKWRNRWKRWE